MSPVVPITSQQRGQWLESENVALVSAQRTY